MSDFSIIASIEANDMLGIEIEGKLNPKQYEEIINCLTAIQYMESYNQFKTFINVNNLTLTRSLSNLTGRIVYRIDHAEYKKTASSRVLRPVIGSGKTDNTAIQALVVQLSGNILIIKAAHPTDRREIIVPQLTIPY